MPFEVYVCMVFGRVQTTFIYLNPSIVFCFISPSFVFEIFLLMMVQSMFLLCAHHQSVGRF